MKTLNKLSKKVLSCILALVMVVCSLTTTLAVFAADEATVAYKVTYGSPAIPMFKDKVIDLTAVNVQFTSGGDFVPGTDITWNKGTEVITTFTADSVGTTKLTATYGGQTQNVYVITNNEGDYNFYLVNENLTGAGNFNSDEWIFGVTGDHVQSNPFTNRLYAVPTTTATSNSKLLFHNSTTTNMYDDPVGGNNSSDKVLRTDGCLANSMSVLFYKSDILKDFADYTIQYETVFRINTGDANTKTRSYLERLGIIARADIDSAAAATLHTADSSNNSHYVISNGTSFIGSNGGLVLANHRYSGLEVARLSNPGATGTVSYYTADHKYFGTSTASDKKVSPLFDEDDSTEKPTWEEYHKYNIGIERKAVKIKLSGQDIVYTLKAYGSDKEVTVLDTINNGNDIKSTTFAASANPNTQSAVSNDAFKSAVGEVSRGTVGFMVTGNTIAHAYFNLTVKLNVESAKDMPIFGIINEDTPGGDTPDDNTPIVVNPNSPAFGMYVNTQVSLANIYMTLNNGQEYVGSELNFELGDASLADKASVNNADKTFAAFATGVYKVVVKNSDASASANLYFVVNEEGDNNFYLVNENLTGAGNFNSDEWIFGVTGDHVQSNPFTNRLYAVPTTTANTNSKLLFHNNTNTNLFDAASADDYTQDYVLRTDGSLANSMGVLFYKSDILKDFADYTIQYDTVFRINMATDTSANTRSYAERLGIIARADIDSAAAATLHTADSSNNSHYVISNGTSFIGSNGGLVLANHRYSGLMVARLSNPGGAGTVSYYTADNKYFGTSTSSKKVTPLFDSDDSTEKPTWEEYNKYNIGVGRKTVKVKLSGQDIVYTLKAYGSDGEVTVLDTINNGNDIKSTTLAATSSANTQSAVSNDEFKGVMGEVSKGTIGFMVTGGVTNGYLNLSVKLNDTEVVLPYTVCYGDTIPVNHAIELAKTPYYNTDLTIVSGGECAIVKNDIFAAIKTGSVLFSNGYCINITTNSFINTLEAKRFAPNKLTVTQSADGYNFTVNKENNIIPGSFRAFNKDTATDIIPTLIDNSDTITYSISYSGALSDLSVTAQFENNNETLLTNIYEHSQGYNPTQNGIRFLSAIPSVRKNGENAVAATNVKEIGTIIIPTVLLNGSEINESTIIQVGDNTVEISGAVSSARKIVYDKCQYTDSYYTRFAASLINIPDDMHGIDITAVTYIKYENGSYTFSEPMHNSYNTVSLISDSNIVPKSLLTTEGYQNNVEELVADNTTTVATENYLSNIDYLGDKLKDSIVYNTSDITECSGTKYYISNSGKDSNDGKSPEKAWATLDKLKNVTLKEGDLVLLERGSVWYGSLPCANGVTYSAYGTGPKPRILNSVSGKTYDWVSTSTTNVWKYSGDIAYIGDVGVVVYDDGKSYGEQRENIDELKDQGDFVYLGPASDVAEADRDYCLYIYSVKNPNEQYSQIDISLGGSGFKMPETAQNITINNLELLYGQDYFFLTSAKNIFVSDCVFGWQGGQSNSKGNRYGGGGGAWLDCDNLVFDHCYFYQQFDTAVTPQYNGTYNGSDLSIFNKFIVKNSLIEKTEYGFEYFTTQSDTDNNKITNMYLGYNFFRDIGEGFGNKPERSACVKSWEHENTTYDSVIEYNIFDRPLNMTLEITGKKQNNGTNTYDNSLIPTIRNNLYISIENKNFNKINGKTYTFNEQAYTNLNNLGIDLGSKYVFIEK